MKDSAATGARPRYRRYLKKFLLLVATLLLAVCAKSAYSFYHSIGGFDTLLAMYRSWREPGSQVFADNGASVPAARQPSVAAAVPQTDIEKAAEGLSARQAGLSATDRPTPATVIVPSSAMQAQSFRDRDRIYVLCLGVDYNHDRRGIQYTRSARTDTVFVVAIDRHAEQMTVLSIPRDMRVAIPGHGSDKINSAYSLRPEGARDLTVKTVEQFLGLHIDHTVIIKPYAAEHFVEAVGGVDLAVEKTMDYDDNWGNLHIHLKKGRQHLNGRQAVGYIRFRHDDEGDRGRIRRQQQFLNTMLTQLKRVDTLSRLTELKTAFQHDIQTSLTYDQLIDLAMLYRGFDRQKMRAMTLSGSDASIGGVYYMIPDERQKQRAVARLTGRPVPPEVAKVL